MATEAKTEEAPVAAEPVKEVRNVILTGFGGIKTVKTQLKPQVSAKEGEVVIRVKACGLNFVDLMVRQGVIDNPPKTPVTMGFECCGQVEELGENTTGFQIKQQNKKCKERKDNPIF